MKNDPNLLSPVIKPTLVLSEVMPGTNQKIHMNLYGPVSDDRASAARKEIRYRADQLAPIPPKRERRERTSTPRGPVEEAMSDGMRRRQRTRRDDVYAA